MGSSKQGWDIPACSQAAVSIHISLRNIPQIRSLFQQPSQVRTLGRTTQTWWLRKQQVTTSRARSSISFGGVFLNAWIHLGQEGKEFIPVLQLGKSLLGELEGLQQG